jgi:hypothetical protein
LRRALSGLLHDSALDQLEAIGLGQDPVLHHLVVLIDGQSFRGRAHDPAPPESTTVAILAAFLASSACELIIDLSLDGDAVLIDLTPNELARVESPWDEPSCRLRRAEGRLALLQDLA